MNIKIPFLKAGDTVTIEASARKVNALDLAPFVKFLESYKLKVVLHEELYAQENQFAGSDILRAKRLQEALDNHNIKAIFFAKGGYGTSRIIDLINFEKFVAKPKWIVGYSDITVLHNHINSTLDLPTIHADMALGFTSKESSFHELMQLIMGVKQKFEFQCQTKVNKNQSIIGEIVGGNLSIIYSQLATSSSINTKDKILFIEDLEEYLYHIDRMVNAMYRANKLKDLKGLMIGNFSKILDNEIPFGKTVNEIVLNYMKENPVPFVSELSIGHCNPNWPIIFNSLLKLTFMTNSCTIEYLGSTANS
jgi:muramoyltetrapeptide carboxypeptidase